MAPARANLNRMCPGLPGEENSGDVANALGSRLHIDPQFATQHARQAEQNPGGQQDDGAGFRRVYCTSGAVFARITNRSGGRIRRNKVYGRDQGPREIKQLGRTCSYRSTCSYVLASKNWRAELKKVILPYVDRRGGPCTGPPVAYVVHEGKGGCENTMGGIWDKTEGDNAGLRPDSADREQTNHKT
jgi:hypothetical protein